MGDFFLQNRQEALADNKTEQNKTYGHRACEQEDQSLERLELYCCGRLDYIAIQKNTKCKCTVAAERITELIR